MNEYIIIYIYIYLDEIYFYLNYNLIYMNFLIGKVEFELK